MTERAFGGVQLLLIDGNNFLHRRFGSVDTDLQRQLLRQVRRAIPGSVRTLVVFDGPAEPFNGSRERIGGRLERRHAGQTSADEALVAEIQAQPFGVRHATVLVTDDRALTERARGLGAETRRLSWLQQVLDTPAQPEASIGLRRLARPSGPRDKAPDEERAPWQPGRGATRKIGNPRRGRRTARG